MLQIKEKLKDSIYKNIPILLACSVLTFWATCNFACVTPTTVSNVDTSISEEQKAIQKNYF